MQQKILDANHTVSYSFDDTSSKLSMLIQFYAIDIEESYKTYIQVLTATGTYLTDGALQKHDNSQLQEKMQFFFSEHQKFKKLIRQEANKHI